MKIRALKSFSGLVSMYKGEVKDVSDEVITNDLIGCGYAEPAEKKADQKKADKKKAGKK